MPDNGQEPDIRTRSEEMSEVARSFYANLQNDGISAEDGELREEKINAALEHLDQTVPTREKGKIAKRLSYQDVEAALKAAASGSATGLDGLPYELWKTLHERCQRDKQAELPAFNIVAVLTRVYNDVEEAGVQPGTGFADGWICPLYKKLDKRNITNYRPITLINTDYKLMTKALTQKILRAAPMVVHPDQAGFMPNRNIFDQTRLARLMGEYAESREENGVIVALDQEKAYDKIAHDYLWRVLRKLNFPENFIRTVKSLYESAESVVIINGVISGRYRILRGVRQGDPLSCLLFDFAIEPLACMLRKSNLNGFQLENRDERLLTMLFADDTTVYLSESDSFEAMNVILDDWCMAARARFNISKTNVIPIGTPEFRREIARTRKLNQTSPPIPEGINIIPDNCDVRILGARVGNNIMADAPWLPILETIQHHFDLWDQCHPTIFGRKMIVEMEVGGRTQYLAKVQGMPKHVQQQIIKMTRSFIWKGQTHPMIGMDTLFRPVDEGGLNLLDIKSRLDAIETSWLPALTDLSESRPAWAYVHDALAAANIQKSSGKVVKMAQIQPLLQSWDIKKSALPDDLKRLWKVMKQYRVSFAALKLSRKLKKKLPIWYHLGANPTLKRLNNAPVNRCLKDNHRARSVGDITSVVERRENNPDQSRPCNGRRNCACAVCRQERDAFDCSHPEKCYRAAKALLATLAPKWCPEWSDDEDGLSLTKNRKRDNKLAREHVREDGVSLTFNPSITTRSTLEKGFRIFTDPDAQAILPGRRQVNALNIQSEGVVVYTDGSCDRNGDEDARAGAGVFYGDDDPRNAALRVPGRLQSNQSGELAAIVHVAEREKGRFGPLTIVSDSLFAIDGFTTRLEKMEQNGFIGVAHKDLFKAGISHLRQRGAPTQFEWVKGHASVHGNEEADALAKRGVEPDGDASTVPLQYDPRFILSGAQISTLTQSLAYKAIRGAIPYEPRTSTVRNLDVARYAVQAITDRLPTDGSLWKSLRSPDISRNIREFLWKCMHNAYRVGDWWLNIPQYEHRAQCPHCQVEDSMEHILLECTAPGQSTVWRLAKQTWEGKGIRWPQVTFGTILGCGMAKFNDDDGEKCPGADRLFKIIISEAAHLIWKLRCERTIQRSNTPEDWHSEREIEHRWRNVINTRLKLDRVMCDKTYGSRSISQHQVLETWRGTLQNEAELPSNWLYSKGVLVGIGPRERGLRRGRPRGDPGT